MRFLRKVRASSPTGSPSQGFCHFTASTRIAASGRDGFKGRKSVRMV